MTAYPARVRHGSGAWLTLDASRLQLTFKRPLLVERLRHALEACGLVRDRLGPPSDRRAGLP